MDADGAALDRGDAAHLVGVQLPAGGRHPHIGGEGGAAVEAHGGAALEVGGDQQGNAGVPLQDVELGGDVERRADGDDDAADLQRVHPRPRLDETGVIGRGVGAGNPRHDQLADLGAKRQAVEQVLGPGSTLR